MISDYDFFAHAATECLKLQIHKTAQKSKFFYIGVSTNRKCSIFNITICSAQTEPE